MPISRRAFLRLSVLGAGSIVFAACGARDYPNPATISTSSSAPLPTMAATPVGRTPSPKPGQGQNAGARRTPQATRTPSSGQGSTAGQTLPLAVPAHPIDVILGRPEAHAVTASLLAYQDMEGCLRYGVQPGVYPGRTAVVSLPAGRPVEVPIAGLQADTAYRYQVLCRTAGAAEFAALLEATFHTQRSAGSAFTFTVQADPHLDSNSNTAMYERALANALACAPDFHIDLGDTFMTGKYQPYTAAQPQYLAQRYYLGKVARAAPLFLALGNHDGEEGGMNAEMMAWASQMRTRFFPNPVPDGFYGGNGTPDPQGELPQDYYAWEWGDALLVVLDPYRYAPSKRGNVDNWNATLGAEQYRWLQATLAGSRARCKFVFIHQLVGGLESGGRGGAEAARLYEWGGSDPDGSWGFASHRPGWQAPIHQLLVDNGVTAVFHGHDHLFARQELDGVIYQEVPQPSVVRADAVRMAQEYGYASGDIVAGAGCLRVTVSADKVTVALMRACLDDGQAGCGNGEVAFAYAITPGQGEGLGLGTDLPAMLSTNRTTLPIR